MMIFSLVAMTGLEKCCITSAYLQWLCHSGERPVARGPIVHKIIILNVLRIFLSHLTELVMFNLMQNKTWKFHENQVF